MKSIGSERPDVEAIQDDGPLIAWGLKAPVTLALNRLDTTWRQSDSPDHRPVWLRFIKAYRKSPRSAKPMLLIAVSKFRWCNAAQSMQSLVLYLTLPVRIVPRRIGRVETDLFPRNIVG